MASDNPTDFDIALIGMGVQHVTHMTLEAIEVLKCCRRGFVAGPDQKGVDSFRAGLASYLKPGDSLPPLVSLAAAYRQDRRRADNYQEAAGLVLAGAASERPVAYLTYGNPVTYDTVAQEILTAAGTRGLRAAVMAGVSSVDTVLVDLRREPGPGLQVFEASCFVGAGVKPDTRFACLLMQVGVFGTTYAVIGRAPRLNALAPLKDYLLQFYPPDHPAVLVRSATERTRPASVYTVPVASLDQVPATAQRGASLYISALGAPRLEDQFRERMESRAHLDATYTKAAD